MMMLVFMSPIIHGIRKIRTRLMELWSWEPTLELRHPMTFSTSDGWRPNVSQIIMHWHNPSRILGPSDIPTTSLSAASAQLPVSCPADLQLLSTCDSFLNEGASRLRPTKPSNVAWKWSPPGTTKNVMEFMENYCRKLLDHPAKKEYWEYCSHNDLQCSCNICSTPAWLDKACKTLCKLRRPS